MSAIPLVTRVSRHPLMEDIDVGRLQPLLRGVKVKRYRTGEGIVSPWSRDPALYLVLSGRLCTYDLTPDGDRLVLECVEAGGVGGFLLASGLKGRFSEAVVASEVATIDRQLLERMLMAEPQLAVNLLWALARRLQLREDRLRVMGGCRPARLLAGELLALAENVSQRSGDTVVVRRISHTVLAEMLGMRRETVTLHMSRLRAAGAIEVEEKDFRLNLDLLAATLEDGGTPS